MTSTNKDGQATALSLPLVRRLVELAHREHYNCEEDTWYGCPLSRDGCSNDAIPKECNCGADAHNAEVAAITAQILMNSTNTADANRVGSDAGVRRFLFRFLFHPATAWNKPYQCEEIFEGRDEAEARRNFETTWYRNTSNETCEELASPNHPQRNASGVDSDNS